MIGGGVRVEVSPRVKKSPDFRSPVVSDSVFCHFISFRWYQKDENCFPVSYILQPVTTWIPNYFNDKDLSLKQEAQGQWQSEYNAMREFLQQAAKEVFEEQPDVWHKYVRSGEVYMNFLHR